MRLSKQLLVLAIGVGVAAPLVGQGNRLERRRGKKEIKQAQQMLARDQKEVEEFQTLIGKFDAARRAGDQKTLLAAHGEILQAGQREIEQAKKRSRKGRKS